jgi:vacuolar-type H+-ATPase subunit I/STV1
MNEFFRCPSYVWGYTIILMLFALVMYMVVGDVKTSDELMSAGISIGISSLIFGILVFGWTIWSLVNWFSRSPMCKRVGFPMGEFKSPWSQVSGIPAS